MIAYLIYNIFPFLSKVVKKNIYVYPFKINIFKLFRKKSQLRWWFSFLKYLNDLETKSEI